MAAGSSSVSADSDIQGSHFSVVQTVHMSLCAVMLTQANTGYRWGWKLPLRKYSLWRNETHQEGGRTKAKCCHFLA